MSALGSLIATALEHAAHSLPVVDALAAGWEVRHGVDVDMAEAIAIMQVRRLNKRREAGERAS